MGWWVSEMPAGTYKKPVFGSRENGVQAPAPPLGIPGGFFQVEPSSGVVPWGPRTGSSSDLGTR